MDRIKYRLFLLAVALCALLNAGTALAREEGDYPQDARIAGYDRETMLEDGSTALTWLLLIFLAVVGLSVLFKNAKRTHLD